MMMQESNKQCCHTGVLSKADSRLAALRVIVVWLYHPPYTLYYLDSHSSVSIGYPVLAVLVLRPRI